jgi:S-adenosylmethionine decarboxylase
LAIEGSSGDGYKGKPDILPPLASTSGRGRSLRAIDYSHAMQGLHLTADLYQCRCDVVWLTDPRRLGDWCLQAMTATGLQPLEQIFHLVPGPDGAHDRVSAAVLLEDSHVCLHTWPGRKAVTLDVYVANLDGDDSAKARALMLGLIDRFQPEWTEQRSLDRGDGE